MTPKEWLALFAFYAAYLFFGSSVFYHNEHALETERRAELLAERIEMNAPRCESNQPLGRSLRFVRTYTHYLTLRHFEPGNL